jgi:hypothetical protein
MTLILLSNSYLFILFILINIFLKFRLDQAINQDLNESLNRVNYQLTSKGYSSLNLDVNHPGTSRVLSVMEDLLLEQEVNIHKSFTIKFVKLLFLEPFPS